MAKNVQSKSWGTRPLSYDGKYHSQEFYTLQLPSYWGFYGDSQTEGVGAEANTIRPPAVFQAIYEDSGHAAPTSVTVEGLGGRSLAGTRTAFDADTYAGNPWIHVQESGNQDQDGQRTASEWGATFQSFMTEIHSRYPSAIISYETAYSFQREAEAYRNWTTYNTELDSRIATLDALGIHVVKVDTDARIKSLVTALGYANVCYTEGVQAYHYNATGNLMVVLTMFDAFGYDVSTLDLSSSAVSASDKAACLQVITG